MFTAVATTEVDMAKRVRGGVRIVTVSGLTYYPEELGY